MKYAILSDIHSNIEALQAALDEIGRLGVKKIICCGDVIGYGPNPKECLDLIRGLKHKEVLSGNHEAAASGKILISDLNEYAGRAIVVNNSLIGDSERVYMYSLKETHSEDNMFFVHGSPRKPLHEYLSSRESMKENLMLIKERICFVGHTHYPLIYSINESGAEHLDAVCENKEFNLVDGRKYIINVGSAGQPRDSDNRGCFVFFNSSKNIVVFHRFTYDIKAVQEKMKSLCLPECLISRLSIGQ